MYLYIINENNCLKNVTKNLKIYLSLIRLLLRRQTQPKVQTIILQYYMHIKLSYHNLHITTIDAYIF